MLYLITYWLTLFHIPLNSHEVQLARFELSQSEGGQLALEVFVEKHDLYSSWSNFELLDINTKKAVLNDYLATHTQWWFNQKEYTICSYILSMDTNHFTLRGSFENPPPSIHSIELHNQFLLQEIPDHLNIIHVKLHQKLRSFRMDKKRQNITLEYLLKN